MADIKRKYWRVETPAGDPVLNMRNAASPGAILVFRIPTTHIVEGTGEVKQAADGDFWEKVIYLGDPKTLSADKPPQGNETPAVPTPQGWVNRKYLRTASIEPRADYNKQDEPPVAVVVPPVIFPPLPARTPKGKEAQLLDLINQYRDIYGLPAWKPDAQLQASSRAHAENLAKADNVSIRGVDFFSRLTKQVSNLDIGSESVSAGPATPEQVMQAWLKNESLRHGLLHPGFVSAGVAHVERKGSAYENFWVLDVAARKKDPVMRVPESADPSGIKLSSEQKKRETEFLEDLNKKVKEQHSQTLTGPRFAKTEDHGVPAAKPQAAL